MCLDAYIILVILIFLVVLDMNIQTFNIEFVYTFVYTHSKFTYSHLKTQIIRMSRISYVSTVTFARSIGELFDYFSLASCRAGTSGISRSRGEFPL